MKLHLGLRYILAALCLQAAVPAFALEEELPEGHVEQQSNSTNPPLVEVQYQQDFLASYKERRENSGIYFGISYESVDLKNYISTLDGLTYSALFGSTGVPLIHVSFDYKYNVAIGSISAGVDFGTGEVSSSKTGADRSLKLTRYGLGFKYTADMIFSEPYVAPYLGINIWQMGISEKSPTDSFSATTQIGYNYTVGLLLQLDWIDFETAKNTTFNWGLENTFIDIYATQYAKTSAEDDPNTETDFLFGAGLRLEF